MDRVVLTILALITAGIVMSLLLSRYVRKKWIWYVPSIIGVVVIIYFYLKIYFENPEGYEEIGYVILSLMAVAVIIGNFMTNILIQLRIRLRSNRKGNDD